MSIVRHGRSALRCVISGRGSLTTSRRFSTEAAAAAAATEPVAAGAQHSAYPWRGAPEKTLGVWPSITEYFQDLIHQGLFVRAASNVTDDPVHYLHEEMRAGAEFAFRSLCASVFQTSQPLLPAQLDADPSVSSESSAADASTASEAEVAAAQDGPVNIDPKDVMEDALADFFKKANAAAVLAGHKVIYRLDAVLDCTLVRTRVYAGMQRGVSVEDRLNAMQAVMEKSKAKQASLADDQREGLSPIEKESMQELRKIMMQKTIQVDLELQCREVFFVKDMKTDATVQGNEAIEIRPHHLRLEACLQPVGTDSPDEQQWLPIEWQIVDVDSWLNGNELYIEPQEQ